MLNKSMFLTLLVFFRLLLCAAAYAQTAESVFLSIPEPLLPHISEDGRAELVELFKSGLNSEIENSFEDTCKIIKLTDDYLKIQNGSGIMELIVLTMANDSKLICLIQTDCVPVCDSYIDFYSIVWRRLDSFLFFNPVSKSYFINKNFSGSDADLSNALGSLDISLMTYSYDDENQLLRQYFNTPEYLTEDEKQTLNKYLIQTPAEFKWNKLIFAKISQ